MTKEPTVRRPYVDTRCPWVVRLYIDANERELNLVCPDSGVVMYTTPCIGLCVRRAKLWARRHKLPIVPREESLVLRDLTQVSL